VIGIAPPHVLVEREHLMGGLGQTITTEQHVRVDVVTTEAVADATSAHIGSSSPRRPLALSVAVARATDDGDDRQLVEITHPFVPLHGQPFALLDRHQGWNEDRVYFEDGHGCLQSIPAKWTDVVTDDPSVVIGARRAPFRADDLAEIVTLVRGHVGEQPCGATVPTRPAVSRRFCRT
jgi:hypothetical protein